MAAPAVVVVWNSRLSGTDAKPLKNVTFSEDLSDPGVHHTNTHHASKIKSTLEPRCSSRALSRRARCSSEKRARHHRNDHLRGERESRGGGQRGHCDGGRGGVSPGRRGVRRGGCLGAWQRVERFHHLVGRGEGAKDCGRVGMYECGMTGAEEEE